MHVERRHSIILAGPVDRVFPLFTPAGEKLWMAGWDPEFLHPASGETGDGMVFRTGEGDETTLWACVDFEPTAYRVRYVRVTPASRFGFVEVVCREMPNRCTKATVAYAFTALNQEGEKYLSGLTGDAFAALIDGWREMIDRWLTSQPRDRRIVRPEDFIGQEVALAAAEASADTAHRDGELSDPKP